LAGVRCRTNSADQRRAKHQPNREESFHTFSFSHSP
jgi:hypothetical protein